MSRTRWGSAGGEVVLPRSTGPRTVLRPLRYRDRVPWKTLHVENAEWIEPWQARAPGGSNSQMRFGSMLREYRRAERNGVMVPFVIDVGGRLAGQVTLSNIVWGAQRSAAVGYWVAKAMAGQGIAPLAVAGAVDHAFFSLGLHRVEVNIRPENAASLRVVEKLGLREEGLRKAFIYVDGQWRDHRSFAVTAPEVGSYGLLGSWRDAGHSTGAKSTRKRRSRGVE